VYFPLKNIKTWLWAWVPQLGPPIGDRYQCAARGVTTQTSSLLQGWALALALRAATIWLTPRLDSNTCSWCAAHCLQKKLFRFFPTKQVLCAFDNHSNSKLATVDVCLHVHESQNYLRPQSIFTLSIKYTHIQVVCRPVAMGGKLGPVPPRIFFALPPKNVFCPSQPLNLAMGLGVCQIFGNIKSFAIFSREITVWNVLQEHFSSHNMSKHFNDREKWCTDFKIFVEEGYARSLKVRALLPKICSIFLRSSMQFPTNKEIKYWLLINAEVTKSSNRHEAKSVKCL